MVPWRKANVGHVRRPSRSALSDVLPFDLRSNECIQSFQCCALICSKSLDFHAGRRRAKRDESILMTTPSFEPCLSQRPPPLVPEDERPRPRRTHLGEECVNHPLDPDVSIELDVDSPFGCWIESKMRRAAFNCGHGPEAELGMINAITFGQWTGRVLRGFNHVSRPRLQAR